MRARLRLWPLVAMLGLLTACAGLGIRSEAQVAFETGLALFNRGQYNEAIPHFQKAIELDPEFAQAYIYLGRTYLNLSQWVAALSPLRTALRLAPQETKKQIVDLLIDALFGVATSAFQRGDWPASITALKEILQLAPQSQQATTQLVSALLAFGGELLSQGRFLEAMQTSREVLTLAPQSQQATGQLVTALLAWGGQLLAQGKVSEAVHAYTEATQLAPTNLEAYLGLARAFFRNGQLPDALSAASEALRLSPLNPDVLTLLRQLQGR